MLYAVDQEQLIGLLDQYLHGTITAESRRILDDWYQSFDTHPNLYESGAVCKPSTLTAKFSELKTKLGVETSGYINQGLFDNP